MRLSVHGFSKNERLNPKDSGKYIEEFKENQRIQIYINNLWLKNK